MCITYAHLLCTHTMYTPVPWLPSVPPSRRSVPGAYSLDNGCAGTPPLIPGVDPRRKLCDSGAVFLMRSLRRFHHLHRHDHHRRHLLHPRRLETL